MRISFILFILLFSAECNAQWTHLSDADALCFISDSSSLLAGTQTKGLIRSNDTGQTWVQLLAANKITSIAVSNNRYIVGVYGYGIYRSIDYGKSWVVTNYYGSHSVIAMAKLNDTWFTGTDYGLFLSSDNGNSWQNGDSSDTRISENYVFTLNTYGDEIYAGTYGGGVYRIKKDTNGWNYANIGMHTQYVTTVLETGTNLFAGTYDGGVFKLIDSSSNTWDYYSPFYSVFSLVAKGSELFAGTNTGLYLSTNTKDWHRVGFPKDTIRSLFIFGDFIFAGTNSHGIWRSTVSSLIASGVEMRSPSSENYSLKTNYPNPFSETTTIRFDLPERNFVSLKIYDITGREVAVLTNETLDAGSYSRSFNAEGIPSGTYICRLEAGGFREERTLIILR